MNKLAVTALWAAAVAFSSRVCRCVPPPTTDDVTSLPGSRSVVALSAGPLVPGECRAASRLPVHAVAGHKLEKLAASTLNYWNWRDDLTSSSSSASVAVDRRAAAAASTTLTPAFWVHEKRPDIISSPQKNTQDKHTGRNPLQPRRTHLYAVK